MHCSIIITRAKTEDKSNRRFMVFLEGCYKKMAFWRVCWMEGDNVCSLMDYTFTGGVWIAEL